MYCLLQDVDMGYVSKLELEDLLSSLSEEFNFLKAIYDAVCIRTKFSGKSIPLDLVCYTLVECAVSFKGAV